MKIELGKQGPKSKLTMSLDVYTNSQLELKVGNQARMSERELRVVERQAVDVQSAVTELRNAIAGYAESASGPGAVQVVSEATKIANTAMQIVAERKWYSVSAAGLLEAAKAVGDTAVALVGAAVRVIDVLKTLKA